MIQWQCKGQESGWPEPPVNLPSLVWKTLHNRGITTNESIDKLFSPTLKKLKDPYSLLHMDVAVDRLVKALQLQQSVCVYGDFDLDGTSGCALLVQALQELGFENVTYYQPSRLKEGYGLHASALEKLKAQGVDLVVTVDVGITAVKAAERAKQLQIDLIITDHHLPKETLPEAIAVINPNSGNCQSQLGHLCGAGVAFYLSLALKSRLNNKDFNPKDLLDCFTIGTLTDLVPLIDENRVLVKHGLKALENTKRPGLKVLLEELGLWGRPLTSSDVAIRFAPKLNALSRMDSGILPIDLYLVDNELKAKELVKQVMGINQKRVDMQKSAEELARNIVIENPQKGFIFVTSDQFHRGVVGLVATRLAQEYNVPAFVAAIEGESVCGSGRLPGPEFPSLVDALGFAESELNQFGGHAPAAGFELNKENIASLEGKLTEYYLDFYENSKDNKIVMEYDVSGHFSEVHPQFMNWIQELGPFGSNFELPHYRFANLRVVSIKELRGGHLKLELQDQSDMVVRQGLWFSPSNKNEVIEAGINIGDAIEIIAEPQWNFFAGRKTIQLLIKDAKLPAK